MVNYRRGDFFFGLYGFHSLSISSVFAGSRIGVSHTHYSGNEMTWLGACMNHVLVFCLSFFFEMECGVGGGESLQ